MEPPAVMPHQQQLLSMPPQHEVTGDVTMDDFTTTPDVPPPPDADCVVKEPVTLFSLPGEIRNYIYSLALYHDDNGGFIAPLSLDRWSDKSRVGAWTILNGKEEFITMGQRIDDSSGVHNQPHTVLTEKEAQIPQGAQTEPYHGHVCEMQCLVQPALTRVSRQVRDESLPFFYSLNTFHFETFTFYREAEGTINAIIPSPKLWWRHIGDSNLRMIKSLRIIDRRTTGNDLPNVDLKVERRDVGSKESRILGARRKKWEELLQRGEPQVDLRDVSCATPEMQECMAQMQADGPFVRGIEKALARYRTLGLTDADVDWPKMEDRRSGLVMVGNVKGLGDKWILVPGGKEDAEAGPKVTWL